MKLTLNQALKKGIEAHKAGSIEEADLYYTSIIKAQPNHPDANHNIGVLAVGLGKVKESLPFFKIALEANPKITQFWLSYIDALIKLNRLDDAKVLLEKARSFGTRGSALDNLQEQLSGVSDKFSPSEKPTHDEPDPNQLKHLVELYTKGKQEKVLNAAKELLKKFPNSSNLYNLIGAANSDLGNLDAALKAYNRAIQIKPTNADVHNNMGNVFRRNGNLKKAIVAFKKSLSFNSRNAVTYSNLGATLQEVGKLEEAIAAYCLALSIKPNFVEALNNMGLLLKDIIFKKPNTEVREIISSNLDTKNAFDLSEMSGAIISLLKFEPAIIKALDTFNSGNLKFSLSETVMGLSKIPLLLELMSTCPIHDIELEKLLRSIRFGLLSSNDKLEQNTDTLRFQTALALQCYTNEYIYETDHSETLELQRLEVSLERQITNGNQPDPQSILCLSCYKPLLSYRWVNLLKSTKNIDRVLERQVAEPQQEAALKPQISRLGKISDNTSSKVRNQYERNPYPRWVNITNNSDKVSLSQHFLNSDLRLFDPNIKKISRPNILIAGCGTGRHSITTSRTLDFSKILAIDLSLSSLAYAERKTTELGIENVTYKQADILDLGKLNRQFDVIESVGVLHHMNNPMTGWKILTECLKIGGLMRIGLYSQMARQNIVKFREEIVNLGIETSDSAMKSFRNDIISSKLDHHREILKSRDFYSTSELRDLLFHVQEHHFTIPQIKNSLRQLKLKFCGFEGRKLVTDFKVIHSNKDDIYDLEKWHLYEKSNQSTFRGMYQFWCQKIN